MDEFVLKTVNLVKDLPESIGIIDDRFKIEGGVQVFGFFPVEVAIKLGSILFQHSAKVQHSVVTQQGFGGRPSAIFIEELFFELPDFRVEVVNKGRATDEDI